MSLRELQELELKVRKARAGAQDRSRADLRKKIETMVADAGFKAQRYFRRPRRQGSHRGGEVRQSRRSERNVDRSRAQAALAQCEDSGRCEAGEVSHQIGCCQLRRRHCVRRALQSFARVRLLRGKRADDGRARDWGSRSYQVSPLRPSIDHVPGPLARSARKPPAMAKSLRKWIVWFRLAKSR